MRGLRCATPCLAVLALLALTAPAQAVQRYAAPAGEGTECKETQPCLLTQAIKKAKSNDEVIVTPGTYAMSGTTTPEAPAENLDVHGAFAGPMPTITTNTSGPPISFSGLGGRLAHLQIIATANSALGFSCFDKAVVERVIIAATGQFSNGIHMTGGCLVRDSVLRAEGQGAIALSASGTSFGTPNAAAGNLTALASGPESIGLNALALGAPGFPASLNLSLKNSIVQGEKTDIQASALEGSSQVLVGNSNFDSTNPLSGSTIADQGGNQTAAALFVDAAGHDYHQAAGSPTIDAGSAAATGLGAFDPDGNSRSLGSAPDIGAFERVPPPVALPPAPHPPPPGQIQSLTVTPTAFRPVKAGGAIISARKAPVGTTVAYSLSAATRVEFTLERALRGRLVGKGCVKQTRGNRQRKPCRLYGKVKGGFAHDGAAGGNSFRFSGRLNRALARGGYRLTGSTSAESRTAAFKVVG